MMMRLQQSGRMADMSLLGIFNTSLKLLACNAVLAMLVNELYEARHRAKSVEATKSSEAIKPFGLLCCPVLHSHN